MCCDTHETRDTRETRAGIEITYAEREEFRCRCTFGQPCRRRITQEDLRCDWCSVLAEDGHYRKCAEWGGVTLAVARGAGHSGGS